MRCRGISYGSVLPAAGLRGGNWNNGTQAGAFALNLNNAPSNSNNNIGFRCARKASFGLGTNVSSRQEARPASSRGSGQRHRPSSPGTGPDGRSSRSECPPLAEYPRAPVRANSQPAKARAGATLASTPGLNHFRNIQVSGKHRARIAPGRGPRDAHRPARYVISGSCANAERGECH